MRHESSEMAIIDPRDFGKLESQVTQLVKDMDEMKENVQAMRNLMEQSKGGWRVLVFLGGIAGTVGGCIGWFASHIRVV